MTTISTASLPMPPFEPHTAATRASKVAPTAAMLHPPWPPMPSAAYTLVAWTTSAFDLQIHRHTLPRESFQLQAEVMDEEYGISAAPKRKLTCTPCFDALWFCYSPVHQMQQYYRHGVLDNCSGKWSNLVDCLTLKTKRSTELQEILETREKESIHIWSFRTPEEAAANWSQTFGHLDEME